MGHLVHDGLKGHSFQGYLVLGRAGEYSIHGRLVHHRIGGDLVHGTFDFLSNVKHYFSWNYELRYDQILLT